MSDFFNIPDAIRLGLHAVLVLANSQQRLTISTMARTLGVSAAHLAKVLARLEQSAIVEGKPGPKGGYQLARAPDKISLLEIYEALSGPLQIERCPLAVPLCSRNDCPLGPFFQKLNRTIRSKLQQTTLQDIKFDFKRKGEKNGEKIP
ncbi:MAG: Rrf2 family transcriptional regulator [candidate division WOR-3 bacterium]